MNGPPLKLILSAVALSSLAVVSCAAVDWFEFGGVVKSTLLENSSSNDSLSTTRAMVAYESVYRKSSIPTVVKSPKADPYAFWLGPNAFFRTSAVIPVHNPADDLYSFWIGPDAFKVNPPPKIPQTAFEEFLGKTQAPARNIETQPTTSYQSPRPQPPVNQPLTQTPPQTQSVPPAITEPAAQPPVNTGQPTRPGLINNVFAGTDIREALSEVASAAGVTIIPDETIKATPIYIEFRNEAVETAIQKLALLVGAYVKRRDDGVYLLSQGTPDSTLFREFSVTKTYIPQNEPATTLQTLLPSSYKSYVQADPHSNILTISAPEQLAPRILSDIETIDAPPRQFVVEALVAELSNQNGLDTGFSWSWKNFALGDDLSLSYAKAGFADVAKLKALITANKATLRANPRLTAFEGRESNLTVGQETYYSLLTGNVQYPTAQIQLIKTGVTLNFTGYIGNDGFITLNLAPEVSDAIVSVNGNPTTNVRRVTTMVRVRPGETIAIGGLIQETTTHSTSRIPILGYIPLIGELFTQRTNANKRTEVIILITPQMTDNGVGPRGMDSNRQLPSPGGR